MAPSDATTRWIFVVLLLCQTIIVTGKEHPLLETANTWFLDQESTSEKEARRGESDDSVEKGPQGCVSNQQCLIKSLVRRKGQESSALPFCWPDGVCRGERPIVMTISSAPKSNGSIGESIGKPYPVFHSGETMCITIMFNPSIVLLDELWTEKQEGVRMEEEQQRRLMTFQSFPLRLDLEDVWMCSSKRNYQKPSSSRRASTKASEGQKSITQLVQTAMSVASYNSVEDEKNQDVVPHTFIRHYDGSEPDQTGCKSVHASVRRRHILNGGEALGKGVHGLLDMHPSKHEKVYSYSSTSGLSSKICFEAQVLGPPEVPCFIQAKVSVRRVRNLGVAREEYEEEEKRVESLVRGFGFDTEFVVDSSLEKNKKVKGNECSIDKEENKKRRHGNRDHKGSHSRACETHSVETQRVEEEEEEEENVQISTPTWLTVTSSDTMAPHPETAKYSIPSRAVEPEDADTALVETELEGVYADDETQSMAKTVGYYYYYDPEASAYYYYHPHVHCDWDLKFHRGAGICETPGRLRSDATHVLVLILSLVGIIAGIVFCMLDWKSRVLFTQ